MVTLEATARRHDGVTLVEATLANDGPDARLVRVESELDGPVWPPRREGVPAAGWDPEAGTLAVTVAAEERVGVGFATPAEPADPPVSVVEDRPAPGDDGAIDDSPAGVVRALGDPSPPGDALPDPATPPDAASDAAPGVVRAADDGRSVPDDPPGDAGTGDDRNRDGGHAEWPAPDDDPEEETSDDGRAHERESDRETDPAGTRPGGYPAVAAWLDAVERRVERTEGTASDGATRAALAADAERLRAVGERAVELAERAGELAPPEGSQ